MQSEKNEESVAASSDVIDAKEVKIKEEPKENDIKDYAENTMNELLGWYGYDSLNSTEKARLNLEHFTSADDELSHGDDVSHDGDFDSDDNGSENSEISRLSRDSQKSLAAQHRNLVSALTKKHRLTGAPEGTLPVEKIVCAWCQKSGPKHFTLKTSSGTKTFCSEVCFTQCRRASFKKNKVCDWCKHVRHTVNYVDFQDGEQQLQFCSAKCLNQYKMSIFCHETQEHLNQIRSPTDTKKTNNSNEREILITPDLWLKDGKVELKDKETKLNHNGSDNDSGKNRRTRIENREAETIAKHRSSSSLSKSLPERTSRGDKRRSTPKENKSSTPISSGSLEQGNSLPSNIMQMPNGNMPTLSQLLPPQLWGMFAPGMQQFGGMPPWFFQGFMPPMQGIMPPGFPMEGMQRNGIETISQQQPVSPVASEDSVSDRNCSGKSTSGTQKSTFSNSYHRTSSSMDQRFTQSPKTNHHGANSTPMQHQSQMQGHGMPPMTMIMPVPVALPFPVPIPLPLPLTMEKIMAVYEKNKSKDNIEKEKDKGTSPVKGVIENGHETFSRFSDGPEGIDSSAPLFRHSPKKMKSDINENDTTPAGRLSCNSCMTEQSFSPHSASDESSTHYEGRLSSSFDFSLMRKRTVSPDGSLDLSKKPRMTLPLSNNSSSSDAAMDLTKESSLWRTKHDSSGKENRDLNDSASVHSDNETQTGDGKEPKIHIVTPRDDPPLSQQLPLAPADHKYSNRRGLILDIPYNPRRSRSPSPERRAYVARDYRADRGRRRIIHGIRNIKSK